MNDLSPTTHLDSAATLLDPEASGSHVSADHAMSTQINLLHYDCNERSERRAIEKGSHMDRQSVAGYCGGPRSHMLYSLPQGSGQGQYCEIVFSYHCFRRVGLMFLVDMF
jgi:hypothetical protein